jgi:hypothetical protein
MFLSVWRIRLIYWPWIYKLLRPLRPLEGWVYTKLKAPPPLPAADSEKDSEKDSEPKPKS